MTFRGGGLLFVMATQCLWFCVVLSYSESFSLGQAIFFSIVFFFFCPNVALWLG